MYKFIDTSAVKLLGEELNRRAIFLQNISQFQLKIFDHINMQFGELNSNYFSLNVPILYSAIAKFNAPLLALARQLSKDLLIQSKLISVWSDSYSRQISAMVNGMDFEARKIAADLFAFQFSFKNIISSRLLENLHKVVEENEDAAEAFRQAGWPVAPSMPKEIISRVIELHKQEKTRYVSQVIMGYYRRRDYANLVSMVESWQEHDLFAPRMHIFRAALEDHIAGRFTVSVPTLFPNIEGILNDYVHSNNLDAKFGRIGEVYNAVIGDMNEYDLSTWAIANTLLYLLQSNTYSYRSFEEELSRPATRRQITRHTVLHGVAFDYHQPINSLKIFLILDALAGLRKIDNNRNSK